MPGPYEGPGILLPQCHPRDVWRLRSHGEALGMGKAQLPRRALSEFCRTARKRGAVVSSTKSGDGALRSNTGPTLGLLCPARSVKDPGTESHGMK